jgi:hypothetical protein
MIASTVKVANMGILDNLRLACGIGLIVARGKGGMLGIGGAV